MPEQPGHLGRDLLTLLLLIVFFMETADRRLPDAGQPDAPPIPSSFKQ